MLEGKTADSETRRMGWRKGTYVPIDFNIYTNDQPTPDNTRNFARADDLAITVNKLEKLMTSRGN